MKTTKIKLIITYLLLTTFLFALSGCGGDMDASSGAPDVSERESISETPLPTPEPAEESTPTSESAPESTPTPEAGPESVPTPEIQTEDAAILGLYGKGYYNKTEFSQPEQEAILTMLSAIVYEAENNREQPWNDILFILEKGDTMIYFWPDGQVVHQKEGHNPKGYDCSNIDFDLLAGILSLPQELPVELERSEQDIESALRAFEEFFLQFNGCSIDELWYEEYASAYYSLTYLGSNPDGIDIENVMAIFLRYTAGEDSFYTAPEGETLLIYMTRDTSDSEWKFESWFENAITEKDNS